MTASNHLCNLWEHTIVKVFIHDPKSELGLMLTQWKIFNKLENFNSILNYTMDDLTPSGQFELSQWTWWNIKPNSIERSFQPKMVHTTSYGSK